MRDTGDIVLPAFEMDCRDWVVVTPDEAGVPEEVAGTPLLAMLSTVVLGPADFVPASGVLTVGVLDEIVPVKRPAPGDPVATQLVDPDDDPDDDDALMRYLMPAPSGKLALLAEFSMPEGRDPEAVRRVEDLMRSFRWAA